MSNAVTRLISLVMALVLMTPVVLLAQQTNNPMLELIQQLSRLETELRQVRGELEHLAYANQRLTTRQNELFLDLDQRLQVIEKADQPPSANPLVIGSVLPPGQQLNQPSTVVLPGQAPGSAPPAGLPVNQPFTVAPSSQPPTVAPSSQPPSQPPTVALVGQPPVAISPGPTPAAGIIPTDPVDPEKEKADYKQAFDLLKLGKYQEAVAAYKIFLQRYPNGKYAGNAQYWLGEAWYVMRQYLKALAAFQKVLTDYPQSKAPDAMLKIAYVLGELGRLEEAKATLAELKTKYPNTTPAQLADNRLRQMQWENR